MSWTSVQKEAVANFLGPSSTLREALDVFLNEQVALWRAQSTAHMLCPRNLDAASEAAAKAQAFAEFWALLNDAVAQETAMAYR